MKESNKLQLAILALGILAGIFGNALVSGLIYLMSNSKSKFWWILGITIFSGIVLFWLVFKIVKMITKKIN